MSPDFAPGEPRRDALRTAQRLFAEAGIGEARSDARFLLLHTLGLTMTDLALRGEAPLGEEGARALTIAVARRLSGEPVARILGAWEFWGLPFALSPETLVPRPDTETLVEAALACAPERDAPLRLLDLGTGSGCILIALLHERPAAMGLGLDRSEGALRAARGNAVANGVAGRALFLRGDWCAPVAGPFDLIVSNPPYIAAGAIPGLSWEVRGHDPLAALDGGADGLDAYRAILGACARRPGLLAPGGAVLFEVGYDQADAVLALGAASGLPEGDVVRDLAGHRRVVMLRPSSAAR
ncbi:peptide chain release factor N(5)-glutamine methyltransferase [Methylobacterium organophilum]|uniref:Release factor glutamine methyltransferase n=1 Tax=Methylobacterium organophilum TaxID=410 RepID=A0ABQ4T979_METOR|nr:peptide chain release factor N(5)-glutamine methyltransferase [Methylobacterium organophilum]GJE26695.1 Release factor glutamine methyltransferase [Methylobacterium organophilum]